MMKKGIPHLFPLLITLCFILGNAFAAEASSQVDLSTPRRSLENFIFSAHEGDYEKAALSMDLRDAQRVDPDESPADLAWRLKFVMDREMWVVWSKVPNLETGQFEANPPDADGGASIPEGVEVRNDHVQLGTIPLRNSEVPFVMDRVFRDGDEPVWLISRGVVADIDALYREHGIGWLGEYIPPALLQYGFLGIKGWQWIALLLAAIVAFIAGRLLQSVVLKTIVRFGPDNLKQYRDRILRTLRTPMWATVGLIVFYALVGTVVALSQPVADSLMPVFRVAIICVVAWLMIRSFALLTDAFGKPYNEHLMKTDEIRARQFTTQIVVLRRVVFFVLALAAIGYSLYQFQVFRAIGTSVLASAGLAGLVLGIAAQRTLGNIFAGIQLALTQPVRIGDSVVFENEWGWIEEITYTYVVIRIWDQRRLVVPINYLLDRPIQNWTLSSAELLGTAFIYADYRIPLEPLRAELKRICEATDLWDGRAQGIQVTNCTSENVELRAICSASSAGNAWDLRCYVRENLIKFIQELEDGRYLPRTRVELGKMPHEESHGNVQPRKDPEITGFDKHEEEIRAEHRKRESHE